jgi:RecA/RadA recombinase
MSNYTSEILKTFLKKNKESHFNNTALIKNYKVSTGSQRLDSVMGGGFGPGIHRIGGASEGGKTSFCFEVVYNAFKTLPKCKCFYIKAEGRLSTTIQNRNGLKFVSNPDEWENHSVFVFKSNVFEASMEIISDLIKGQDDDTTIIFIVDSVDGLNRKEDMVKSYSESNQVAGSPLLLKIFCKRMSLPITELGHMLFLITQISADIKIGYAKETQKVITGSGGNAAIHFPDWILQMEPTLQGDYITLSGETSENKIDLSNNPILGHWAKVIIKKSSNETTGYKVKYPVRHNVSGKSAVWVEYEISKFLLDWGFIVKGGAWFQFSQNALEKMKDNDISDIPEKINGNKNLQALFDERQDITQFWSDYLGKMMSSIENRNEILQSQG